MRKATTVLMTSTLILSSIYPSTVHATENTIDSGIQNKNTEVQQTTDNVENTVSPNLDAGNNISPEETNSEEVDTNPSSISEGNEEQESLSNVPATSKTNHSSEQTTETETGTMANDNIYASGTLLTSDWYITNEGVLHIGPGAISTVGTGTTGPWGNYRSKIEKIVFDGPVTVNDNMDWLFNRLDKVTEIEHLDLLDTSGATRMRYTFRGMTSLESLDVSTFDTSNVWIMDGMFDGTGVEILDLTAFDTRNVTSMQSLVMSSPNLKKIDVSSFDINSVTTMWSTFAYCPVLEEIDLGSMDFTNESLEGGDILYRSPIKKITVSESARLNEKVSLNTPPTNETYTGKWQNVGSGTNEFPKGDWSGTTEELYERTQEGIADTYVWQPVLAQAEDVTIKYLDEDNKPIADDVVKTGSIGEDYTSEQKEIPGYTFKEVQGNPTGQFSDQAQTVVYIYTKDEITPLTGTVIVKYEDDKGNTLSDSIIKSGTVGENYTTEKKDIKGYFFKETRGKVSGTFADETQTVIYVYSKDDSESTDKDKEKNNTSNENKGSGSKDSENTNGTVKDDDDYSRVTPSNNSSSKSTTDAKKTKEQSLPKAGEKAEGLGIMLGIMLLISVSIFAVLKPKKVK